MKRYDIREWLTICDLYLLLGLHTNNSAAIHGVIQNQNPHVVSFWFDTEFSISIFMPENVQDFLIYYRSIFINDWECTGVSGLLSLQLCLNRCCLTAWIYAAWQLDFALPYSLVSCCLTAWFGFWCWFISLHFYDIGLSWLLPDGWFDLLPFVRSCPNAISYCGHSILVIQPHGRCFDPLYCHFTL